MEKMTSFRNILGHSWTLKFHKVKLLKFKSFKFNWPFFHEKKLNLTQVLSYLELEGQGRGIIMEMTRLLLGSPRAIYVLKSANGNDIMPSVYEYCMSQWDTFLQMSQ